MSSIESKIQTILNVTDYIRFLELLHLFDENNQLWILNILNELLEYPNLNLQWNIFEDEPKEYIAISEEIFDIVDGFICTANRLGDRTVAMWDLYGLGGINKQ